MQENKVTYFNYKKVDSTMDIAKLRVKEDWNLLNSGCVVISDIQTKGRGTKGRSWESDSLGGLYYSLIFQPDKIFLNDSEAIQLLVATQLQDVIYTLTSIKSKIKKPNDIVFDNKKLAGILIEASSKANSSLFSYLNIGIGLNINQTNFSVEIKDFATSLFLISGCFFDKKKFVRLLTYQLLKKFKKK